MKKKWLIVLVVALGACSSSNKKESTNQNKEKEIKKVDEIVEVSFIAVGDNLIHGAIYHWNEDFKPIYEHTNYLTQDADIAYVNMETIAGGEELELSSYPTFNGPYGIIDGLASAGFDWFSASSNHSFDRGEQGIINELNYLDKYPEIVATGAHRTLEESKKLNVIEKNGMKVGILGYTYGLNGFELPEGKEYLVDLIDKDKIKKDLDALKKISDVQVVSMHWGEEYSFQASNEQKELAQFLSDEGVDVIIGAHPHVIQPMDYVTGVGGNETLVMYSLGNFLSAQDVNYRMLGGMGKWSITYNKTTKKVQFKDVQFLPTITHIENNYKEYKTYVLKDYTDELASRHTLKVVEKEDISREYFINLTNEVMNDKIDIVY